MYQDHKVGLPMELFSLRFMITYCIGVKTLALKRVTQCYDPTFKRCNMIIKLGRENDNYAKIKGT